MFKYFDFAKDPNAEKAQKKSFENQKKIIEKLKKINKTIKTILKEREELIEEIQKLEIIIPDELKEEIIEEIQKSEANIIQGISTIVQTSLTSEDYAAFLKNTLNQTDTTLGEILPQYQNELIEISTTGGTLSGTITQIEEDYLVFQELLGSIALIPFIHIISFTMKGEE